MSVQDRIAELEREVARKKALVNAKITLPKDTPEAVKTEVMAGITEALLKLAGNEELELKVESTFSNEEIKVLKLLANKALGKSSAKAVTTSVVNEASEKQEKPLPLVAGEYKGREAEILDLEGVPVAQRGKISSMEKCLIVEERNDGLMHVLTKSGIRFNIDPQFLNFDIESN